MNRAGTLVRVVTLLAAVAGRALFADDATEAAILAQLQTNATADATYHTAVLFLLQVIGIAVGFDLGFSIWACWLRGRQARNP